MVARRSSAASYAATHVLAILGTTVAVYGALGIAFSPVLGPIPGVTFSRAVGGLLFVVGAAVTVWGISGSGDTLGDS